MENEGGEDETRLELIVASLAEDAEVLRTWTIEQELPSERPLSEA